MVLWYNRAMKEVKVTRKDGKTYYGAFKVYTRKGHIYWNRGGGSWIVHRLDKNDNPGPPRIAPTRERILEYIDNGECRETWELRKVYKLFVIAHDAHVNGPMHPQERVMTALNRRTPDDNFVTETETREEAEMEVLRYFKSSHAPKGIEGPVTIVETFVGIEGFTQDFE